MLTGGRSRSANHHVQHDDLRRPAIRCPMSRVGDHVDTSTARLELVAPGFIEQHYRGDAVFAPGVFERNRKARWKLAANKPHVLLIVLPPELPVHPPSTNEDHYRKDSDARMILALAVVAQSTAVNAATKFYFRYHAQAFDVHVFEEEDEARQWLKEVLGNAT